MAHLVPNLNLSSIHITESFKRIPTRFSSSSYTPPTLESSFDPLPRQGSSISRRKLEKMKDGKDYLMLYRLNAEGKMLKVVRRHDFTPISFEKLARIHHNPLRLRGKVRLNETIEVSQETKQEATYRKNTIIVGNEVRRVASSLNLLAAKRLLSTTLSLEYGSDPQKPSNRTHLLTNLWSTINTDMKDTSLGLSAVVWRLLLIFWGLTELSVTGKALVSSVSALFEARGHCL